MFVSELSMDWATRGFGWVGPRFISFEWFTLDCVDCSKSTIFYGNRVSN